MTQTKQLTNFALKTVSQNKSKVYILSRYQRTKEKKTNISDQAANPRILQ